MVSKRIGIYGFISAAALVSGILVGCGGSSSDVSGNVQSVSATGGLPGAAAGSGPAGTSSGNAPQQVQVTVNGNTQTGTLPAGETIPPSGNVDVLPTGQPIINGLTLAPKAHVTQTKPQSGGHTQGEVDVDGQNTGLTVLSDGSLSGYLILVPGNHVIDAWGPFNITGGSAFSPKTLTVGKFEFGVVVGNDGVGSIPSALSMQLPANGGALNNGSYVKVTYPTPDFATGSGTLILAYSGVTITKTQFLSNGLATYKALSNHPTIPGGGVDSVTFNVQ